MKMNMKNRLLYTLVATLAVGLFPIASGAVTYDTALATSMKGRILLQVESHGEAWYIRAKDLKRYYMKDGAAAYSIMRFFSQGIADVDLAKIPHVANTAEMKAASSACATNTLGNRFRGEILLQVQQHGEAWYVDPVKCRAIYMKDGAVAYEVMRFLGFGAFTRDIEKIQDGGTVAGSTTTQPTAQQPVATPYPCDPSPLQRVFTDSPYYTGLMFDGHFHMPLLRAVTGVHASAPVLDLDVSRRDVVCLFHADRVTGAFAFYGVPSDIKDTVVNAARDIEQTYPGTIKHFLELVTFPGYPVTPSEIEAILTTNAGLFKGYGELSLYLPHYSAVSPNDATMREFYAVAEKYNLPVMMHPLEGQQMEVEQALRDFPNVKFLFHALERMSWANTFFDTDLDRYPNAYYSVDVDLFGQDVNGMPVLDTALDKADFMTLLKQRWQDTLSQKTTLWKARIEKHPNQFLWGTDRGTDTWNYDPEVGSLLEEYSRAFIGRLDPATQEKYAHTNAESLLQTR